MGRSATGAWVNAAGVVAPVGGGGGHQKAVLRGPGDGLVAERGRLSLAQGARRTRHPRSTPPRATVSASRRESRRRGSDRRTRDARRRLREEEKRARGPTESADDMTGRDDAPSHAAGSEPARAPSLSKTRCRAEDATELAM